MLEVNIKGTKSELCQLWPWTYVCKMIHVDYYNADLIPDNEIFTVNTQDLIDCGLVIIEQPIPEPEEEIDINEPAYLSW